MTGPRRSRQDYVGAAADALVETGGGLGIAMSMDTIAARAGVSRSTMYRWWPTTTDVVTDVMVHRATAADGWDQRFLDQDPALGVRAALDVALTGFGTDASVSARAWVAAWPSSSNGRAVVARHEIEWIAACADWLASSLPGRSDVAWTDVALTLRSSVEGSVLFNSLFRTSRSAPWPATIAADVVGPAAGMAEELVEAMSGSDAPVAATLMDQHSSPDRAPAQQRILERLSTSFFDAGGPGQIALSRIVDLDVLARRLGVSSRRLYLLWPRPADLNQDVIREVITRFRSAIEQHTLAAFGVTVGGQYTHFQDLFVSLFQVILEDLLEWARAYFACTWTLLDREVREVAALTCLDWLGSQRLLLFALQQGAHHHVKGGAASEQLVKGVFSTALGAYRLELMTPGLFERSVTYHERVSPTLAAGLDALFMAYTEPCHHDPVPHDDRHEWAPALRPIGEALGGPPDASTRAETEPGPER